MKKKLSTRILSIFLAMLMVVSILPSGMITAQATTFTPRYSSPDKSGWYSGYSNNCCTYAKCRAAEILGYWAPFGTGGPGGYYDNLRKAGFKVGTQPKVGALGIASGHIFVVESISGNTMIISEGHSYTEVSGSSYSNIDYGRSKGSYDGTWFDNRRITYNTSTGKPNANVIGNWRGYVYLIDSAEPPKPENPPLPNIPSTPSVSSSDIAKGKSITISWNAVSGATGYKLAIRTSENKDIDVGNRTSYTYTLNTASKYDFYVKAYNSTGESNWSNSKSCTVHNPVTVKFVDWDGTDLGSQTVDYGASAKAPISPERKGYSFQGWSESYYNVTSNKTIKATYKINTYTVNFYDKNGDLLKTEKVNYGSDATPPTDTNNPTGYDFLGWDSEAYKNVYTDASNKTININGIYSWNNDDLPVVCQITSASRQPDGYYVYFDLTNYDKSITRGRAVVSLKTASGKLVDTTESAAFSIPISGTKTGMEVFIPCDNAATKIEVIIVDSYSSGVPISEKVSSDIDQGLMWSEWSTEKPDETNTDLEVESRTEYRYRDKETSTGTTKTKDGWIWDGTRIETLASQTGYQDSVLSTYDNETEKRVLIGTQTVPVYGDTWGYVYYHFYKSGGGNHTYCPTNHAGGTYHGYYYSTSPFTWSKLSSCGNLDMYTGPSCGQCGASSYWWYNSNDSQTITVQTGTKTQYNYATYKYTYNFYRWKDWSDWSTNEVASTSNKEVETRTVYRYKSTSAGIENDEGTERTVSGTLDASFAGKQITLYVYGYTGASDYTNEYIGQSVVADDGSYSFTFKLREEPTVKTGDFTVAIGIEGTTNTTIIDTIEAPKPTYEVNFYDWDGTIIETQTVTEGEDAVLPSNPEKEGYDFVGWDKSVTNIRENTDFYADFQKKQYTVVFVDWENQLIEVKTFEYGDVLTTPDYENVEGYTFEGWDEITKGNTIVTSNLVVSAQYEINTYNVTFYDFDGNVIETQEVEYGSTADAPDTVSESSDGKQFAGWFNADEYENVSHDVAVYPAYYFEETTPVPTANYESGEYSDKIQLELSNTDDNAVIYYYLNGDESAERIYTSPITIDKTCSVTYFATSFGKNDSEAETNYYCINSSDSPSEWMLYSELPLDVTDNLDDYNLESETGYRYKDTQSVSNTDEASELVDLGWTLDNVSYSDYTDWQDAEIANDSSKIGFEIDTQEVEDTTVTRYQYSHYKYTDSEGVIQYSPSEVDGYDCEYETVIFDSRLSIAGFLEDNTSYYNYDNQTWFTQTKVNGVKTQYRSRYQVATYYKWTSWTIDSPSVSEQREFENDTVYRYSNKNYHIVSVDVRFGDVPQTRLVQENQLIDSDDLEVIGYDLEGLYFDDTYKTRFELSTPVTDSLYLCAKYNPKQYTVTFQMQDGTELDTQTVEYMSEAIAPETDAVPGYVFGGWDKDFDCITEDTVITGKYYKESEYARISLDKSSANMFQSNSMTLIPTITPSNLTDEVIEWSSSDPGIVSVDDTGKVTAMSAGTATITAMVVKTKETATCKITVENDIDNFITLKTDSSLNHDDLGYLRRVALQSSIETVSKQFANENLKFYNINGTELTSSDFVGTGTQIKLFNGDNVVDTETVVITGDMTGDGIINNRDVAMMNKKLVGKAEAEECQMLAIDVNGDGYVNNRDAAMVARYLVGKDTF